MLFDTLLQDRNATKEKDSDAGTEKKGLSNDEILAVLAHELGHWKGNHVLKQLLITQVKLFDDRVAKTMIIQ